MAQPAPCLPVWAVHAHDSSILCRPNGCNASAESSGMLIVAHCAALGCRGWGVSCNSSMAMLGATA